ncbi:NAD(P)-dependent alcohol dehydrogenase [Candidatus Chloroploca asiatica]|uniref:Alcohol dehydrogenase n=1 Tax=Candidatus Chloroploca asiatica TaxID=1506545 RepID=A0A2H3KI21_9CHLR|nr:NAD(P)-dependent alcohol dehydrogenase [Candidatus Chloroploca asiatica]PDV97454.1 alcohol dehydrogenase [Candidatus Chloroploca asiatica]
MQAMCYRRYGEPEVLRLETVAKPTPGHDDVLIQVHATSLNAADAYLLKGEPAIARLFSGLRRPKHPILGADIAGTVAAVGSRVTQFQPGDAVYGDLSGCGFGGFAEYVCAPAGVLALKPTRLSFAQAAAVPLAAVTALQALRARGEIAAGQQVLIHGASGGVGTFAVQLARSFGATVTAVCSTKNVELARSLGADHVIDYTQEDFTQSDQRYDLILVVNGNRPLAAYRRALRSGGRCVVVGGAIRTILTATLLGPSLSLTWGVSIRNVLAQPSQQDLTFVGGLLESGEVVPVIDRCFPLRELPEALRYRAAGRGRGKVVLTIF